MWFSRCDFECKRVCAFFDDQSSHLPFTSPLLLIFLVYLFDLIHCRLCSKMMKAPKTTSIFLKEPWWSFLFSSMNRKQSVVLNLLLCIPNSSTPLVCTNSTKKLFIYEIATCLFVVALRAQSSSSFLLDFHRFLVLSFCSSAFYDYFDFRHNHFSFSTIPNQLYSFIS